MKIIIQQFIASLSLFFIGSSLCYATALYYSQASLTVTITELRDYNGNLIDLPDTALIEAYFTEDFSKETKDTGQAHYTDSTKIETSSDTVTEPAQYVNLDVGDKIVLNGKVWGNASDPQGYATSLYVASLWVQVFNMSPDEAWGEIWVGYDVDWNSSGSVSISDSTREIASAFADLNLSDSDMPANAHVIEETFKALDPFEGTVWDSDPWNENGQELEEGFWVRPGGTFEAIAGAIYVKGFAAVPEPTTLALLCLGLIGFAASRYRKQ